jgi:ubiquinone/menaquinone biosynthesis C-methylase UbiE
MIDRLLAPKPEERLLEVGSSAGYRVEKYVEKGVGVWGVDKDRAAIAAGRCRDSSLHLLEADATELPFPDQYFDRVLAVHLLEHIPDPAKAVREMARVLKSKEHAVIVVPCERIRGDTAFAGWFRFKNLHLHRFSPPQITSLLLPWFSIEEALFHTLIPGQFKPMPLDRVPLLYYFSLAMLLKVGKR